jgi:hypothetical protein
MNESIQGGDFADERAVFFLPALNVFGSRGATIRDDCLAV